MQPSRAQRRPVFITMCKARLYHGKEDATMNTTHPTFSHQGPPFLCNVLASASGNADVDQHPPNQPTDGTWPVSAERPTLEQFNSALSGRNRVRQPIQHTNNQDYNDTLRTTLCNFFQSTHRSHQHIDSRARTNGPFDWSTCLGRRRGFTSVRCSIIKW